MRYTLCLHPELILTGVSSFAANGDKEQIKVSIRVSSSSDKKNQEDRGNVSEALNKNPIFQDKSDKSGLDCSATGNLEFKDFLTGLARKALLACECSLKSVSHYSWLMSALAIWFLTFL